MDNTLWQIFIVIVGAIAAGSWTHFLVSRRDTNKEIADLKESVNKQHSDLKERVTKIEESHIKENDVRHIVRDILDPLTKAMDEIKTLVQESNKTILQLQLDAARRDAREEALKEDK